MLNANPDIVNSCRVCRNPNQDGDYECLYETTGKHEDRPLELTEAGILYENLLNISLKSCDNYPQFLCNSCDLQMKLFKKLKDKAYKTLAYLQKLYDVVTEVVEEYEVENIDELVRNEGESEVIEEADEDDNDNIKAEQEFEEQQEGAFEVYGDSENDFPNEYQESEANDYQQEAASEYQENVHNELPTAADKYLHCLPEDEDEYMPNAAATSQVPLIYIASSSNQYKADLRPTISGLKYRYSTEAVPENTHENIPQIRLDLEPVIDKNDYVTEIYELLDDESRSATNTENHEEEILEYDVCNEGTTTDESATAFSDIEYIMDDSIEMLQTFPAKERKPNTGTKKQVVSGGKKREYKCVACQLNFKNSQELKSHRSEIHDNKYPCSVCSKEFKSPSVLHQHMKTHKDQPGFQCEICPKTFSQKVHYQYHMNHHNNVRNFKCNECSKSFITKTDLKFHQRSHTGERPYVCNICGKDYLMMEHLKTHQLMHTNQEFLCNICNQRFVNQKTLRLHVRTIHEDEPKFKCELCFKSFRRKHHLQYHLRSHRGNVKS